MNVRIVHCLSLSALEVACGKGRNTIIPNAFAIVTSACAVHTSCTYVHSMFSGHAGQHSCGLITYFIRIHILQFYFFINFVYGSTKHITRATAYECDFK